MKTRKMYNSKEEFERLHPYVCVEAPNFDGKKYAPAQIIKSFTSKKVAENRSEGGLIMTRKQAEKFIKRWNEDFKAQLSK